MASVCEWFGLKTTRTVSPVWPQNRWREFLAVWPQNLLRRFFSSLTLKLVVTVSPCLTSKPAVDFLVEHQRQGGGGFSGLRLKTDSFDLVI
jgi:hypothetical protein